MTRWKPSVSSWVSSAVFGSFSVVASAILPSLGALFEEIPVLLDMRRQVERVLARQRLGSLGVAPLERLDDLHMIDDRALRAIVLADRRLANGAHVNEEIFRHIGDELVARKPDDRLMEFDIGVGIFVEMPFGRAVLKLVEKPA